MNAYCNGIAWRKVDVERLKEETSQLKRERDHYRDFIYRLIEFTKERREPKIRDMCYTALEEAQRL